MKGEKGGKQGTNEWPDSTIQLFNYSTIQPFNDSTN